MYDSPVSESEEELKLTSNLLGATPLETRFEISGLETEDDGGISWDLITGVNPTFLDHMRICKIGRTSSGQERAEVETNLFKTHRVHLA